MTAADANDVDAFIEDWTDAYFLRTREIVAKFGDIQVTYAIFMRRPVVSAPRLAIDWLNDIIAARGSMVKIDLLFEEGRWVGAGEPLMYITGSFHDLCDLETLFLQKIGPACVSAYNAFTMCQELPNVAFLAMDARHCAGTEMAEIMAYAASVGSDRAKRKSAAVGFIGNATNATARYFGRDSGLGTMPHALIGYAESTVRAAEMFHEAHPDQPLTVLVDYFGLEVSDALAVCHRFPEIAAEGRLSVRIDTPGGRFLEGLDPANSYAVLDRNAPRSIRGYRNEGELRHLIGPGVSAAAVWHMREALNNAGFPAVKIVASSGFGPEKCKVMALADTPINVIGTGSYLPERWAETYATADIVEYDGQPRVKVGREFLLRKPPVS
ncbi:MAG: nicotinate phosphoribosyltransferase [Rhodospirillaceae bacterium]|jgi:nicotinate phosphoribosyltransferase|uniref:nicotinate phosphoribosyltransferase n=1 Tax=Hwanghaeella sp. 1Z406 TaxID=3402811 RepID=UPI000C3BEAB2|nr:nicotinate phosphoribosyltransferase [Rhodospirillales bacterium]MAX48479.1 nicotinate phosphoribosyltransferase [Rhodospirillaceae bacterium]|tara:strand:+ start:107914 stop:109059 length:1146 start_codon:yes stop_codon:yes gene_type:complete